MNKTRMCACLLVLGLWPAALVGCGGTEGGAEGGAAQAADGFAAPPCVKAKEDLPPEVPVVAILVQPGESGPRRDAAVDQVLDGATRIGARVIVNGIDGGPDASNLVLDVRMAGQANNATMRKANLDCKRKAVQDAVRAMTAKRPPERLDILAALGVLAQDVKELRGPVHVVLATTGLQTGVVDLRQPDEVGQPERTINLLVGRRSVPACNGWRVSIVKDGAGSADAYPELLTWWQRLFARCGGTLVSFNTALPDFPLYKPVAAPEQRQVAIDIKRSPATVVATVRGKLLFKVNDSRLTSAAGIFLKQRLLPLLSPANGGVLVEGHTDDTGPDSVNERLSRARAARVASWIVEHTDIPAAKVAVKGWGSRRPVDRHETQAARALNRRVVVTISRGGDEARLP